MPGLRSSGAPGPGGPRVRMCHGWAWRSERCPLRCRRSYPRSSTRGGRRQVLKSAPLLFRRGRHPPPHVEKTRTGPASQALLAGALMLPPGRPPHARTRLVCRTARRLRLGAPAPVAPRCVWRRLLVRHCPRCRRRGSKRGGRQQGTLGRALAPPLMHQRRSAASGIAAGQAPCWSWYWHCSWPCRSVGSADTARGTRGSRRRSCRPGLPRGAEVAG